MAIHLPASRIAAGRTDLVVEYLAAGGDARSAAANGTSLLAWCAYYGDVSAIKLLVSRGATLDVLGPGLGLNAAAFHGHWRLCQYLLEQEAPVNDALPDTKETPLHSALVSEDRVLYDAVVQVLLKAGADPRAKTTPGVLTGSFMRDSRTRGETPLHRAAAFVTASTVQRLLNAGADLETTDAYGDTALAWASWHRRPLEVIRLLCHGPHRIHPEYKSMRENLIGDPRGGDVEKLP
jgi:ankyrin repeat protein